MILKGEINRSNNAHYRRVTEKGSLTPTGIGSPTLTIPTREERSNTMIAQNTIARSIGELPFSSVKVSLDSHFNEFSIRDIEDTFNMMVYVLDHIEGVVAELGDDAYQATGRGLAKEGKELMSKLYTFAHEGHKTLPLLLTQIGALKLTASAMSRGLGAQKK